MNPWIQTLQLGVGIRGSEMPFYPKYGQVQNLPVLGRALPSFFKVYNVLAVHSLHLLPIITLGGGCGIKPGLINVLTLW
jgi:hypothetical protein